MNFTAEHIRIIKKNKVYSDTLERTGTLKNVSSVIIDEFIRVFNEAIDGRKVNTWCGACMVEVIELVYKNYAKHIENELHRQAEQRSAPGVKPGLSELENKRTEVLKRGRNAKKDR